jgi:hypothetical protein
MRRIVLVLGLVGPSAAGRGQAQPPPEAIATERAEFARWLREAATSPLRAIAQVPVGPGVTLGPASADVPLTGVAPSRVEERDGRVSLTSGGTAARPLVRDRALSLGTYQIVAGGLPGQAVITVYGRDPKPEPPPAHFPYAAAWRLTVSLEPPATPRTQRLLAPDGTEVMATDAGAVTFTAGGTRTALRVFRIPTAGGEESELEVYFQDSTNGRGSYPAGRFVNLVPDRSGRYVLDFNRARNPFCAYNTVFACPAPWRGNRIPSSVAAGERYHGAAAPKPAS